MSPVRLHGWIVCGSPYDSPGGHREVDYSQLRAISPNLGTQQPLPAGVIREPGLAKTEREVLGWRCH